MSSLVGCTLKNEARPFCAQAVGKRCAFASSAAPFADRAGRTECDSGSCAAVGGVKIGEGAGCSWVAKAASPDDEAILGSPTTGTTLDERTGCPKVARASAADDERIFGSSHDETAEAAIGTVEERCSAIGFASEGNPRAC